MGTAFHHDPPAFFRAPKKNHPMKNTKAKSKRGQKPGPLRGIPLTPNLPRRNLDGGTPWRGDK